MFTCLARQIGTVILALGIIMGTVGPSWADMHPSNAPATMAKMQMQNDCMGMAKKGTNNKQMPCDGTGCGCCLCGTCAAPPALDVTLPVQFLERPSKNDFGDDVIPKGTIAPPTLPPPILRA
jgi:hypothetical protein